MLADSNLFSPELALSVLTAYRLDRFLFSGDDAKCGFSLHQGPTRKRYNQTGSLEAADIYICENADHCYGAPVAFGDMKLYHFETAIRETGLYCSTSCLAQSGVKRESPIYIGLPCSKRELSLYVYIENKYSDKHDDDGHSMWDIPVARGSIDSKKLLCTLYCGVHFLQKASKEENVSSLTD